MKTKPLLLMMMSFSAEYFKHDLTFTNCAVLMILSSTVFIAIT